LELTGAVCLVTGATSGIGRATALRLLEPEIGASVIALGRDAGALDGLKAAAREKELPADRLATVRADLAEPGDIDLAVQEALAAFGHIDALVNNAAQGYAGPFADQDADGADYLVRVNLIAPIRLTRALLPAMVERRRGAIVNVSSIAGHVGVKDEAVYASTKAGLIGLSESLRYELKGSGVSVSVVSPGVVQTAFFERRGRPYDRRFPRPIPPERVAEAIVHAIGRGRPQLFVPGWMAFPARIKGTLPGLYRGLAGRFAWRRSGKG
jgi:short-subunit dehydrogenase